VDIAGYSGCGYECAVEESHKVIEDHLDASSVE
jgi:hypothetical protein